MTPTTPIGEGGIDIISVAKIDALITSSGERFLRRWFTDAEIEYCSAKAVPSRHFAARMAAKEAVAKVIPAGWDGPLAWRSIEITRGAHGKPAVRLSGAPLELATAAGIGEIKVSLSHCDEFATAIAFTSAPAAVAVREAG